MFLTLLIIIIVIICIVKANKPDKKDAQKVSKRILKLPKIYLKSKKMSSFDKFMNLAYDDSSILSSFVYENGSITLTMGNGKVLCTPLSATTVRFEKYKKYPINVSVSASGQKVKFYEMDNFYSNKEWELIYRVLCLAGVTYGTDIFWYWNISDVGSIIKILNSMR